MTEPRTLVLLRHAKAEGFAGSDEARPLAVAGRRQATAVGQALQASGPVPDAALVSSAVRTRQTWELLASGLTAPPEPELLDDLYDATARSALDLVRHVEPDVRTLLVVGHEPVMSSLALLLAGPGSIDLHQVSAGIPTATRCVLTLEGPWAELGRQGAALTAVVRTPHE
ncbi:phosphohistidine phosphatase [Serinibacter arcticus]|uniref:Phosphohistidine phosphatase n=1 Tax=Serinibacter arcticus TaxID=1655435 RepID=A0A2U1ZRG2_9MICO|nr:histidine phosphatase family protein [Serinibacter arcticus]PWD49541.1 phosphohistidine phosphatase [Serinibacter arcticus]